MTKQLENPKDIVGSKKLPMSYIPFRVLTNVGLAMLEGGLKYGRFNYRAAGVRASVYFDAVVARHMTAWWEGEDIDADSDLHHLDKAIAALMVMRDSMLEGNFIDDRPPRGNVDMTELNKKAGALIDRYGHVKPKHYTIADTPPVKTPQIITSAEDVVGTGTVCARSGGVYANVGAFPDPFPQRPDLRS
jgi:hypothetical protein